MHKSMTDMQGYTTIITGSGIFLVVMFAMNLYGARGWGEAEYWFSLVKIICVIVFVIVGCLTSGGVIG